jgi:hypothetical protein
MLLVVSVDCHRAPLARATRRRDRVHDRIVEDEDEEEDDE